MSFGIESFAKILESVSDFGEQKIASTQEALQRVKSYGSFFGNEISHNFEERDLPENKKVENLQGELKGKVDELYQQGGVESFKKIDELFYYGSYSERMAVYDFITDRLFDLDNFALKSILADPSRPMAERAVADFYLDTRKGMADFLAESISSLIPRMAQEYCDPNNPEFDLLDAQDQAEDRIQRIAEKIQEIESKEPRAKREKISETLEGEKITYYTDDNGKVAGFRIGNVNGRAVHEYRLPDTEYVLNGYTYHTDAQGRVTLIEGNVRFPDEDSVRNQVDQRTSGGMDRAYGDDGGHLVAMRLGGDVSWLNIVPMDAQLNRGGYKAMESDVAKMLKNGENPKIKIEVRYDDQQGIRPSGFTYTVETSDKKLTKVFDNVL